MYRTDESVRRMPCTVLLHPVRSQPVCLAPSTPPRAVAPPRPRAEVGARRGAPPPRGVRDAEHACVARCPSLCLWPVLAFASRPTPLTSPPDDTHNTPHCHTHTHPPLRARHPSPAVHARDTQHTSTLRNSRDSDDSRCTRAPNAPPDRSETADAKTALQASPKSHGTPDNATRTATAHAAAPSSPGTHPNDTPHNPPAS